MSTIIDKYLLLILLYMKKVSTRTIWPVDEPCQIAYRDPIAGYLWLRPYIDVRKKSKIWGIALGDNIVFKLTHESDGDWYTASTMMDKLSRAKMPDSSELELAEMHRTTFDNVVLQLRKLGVDAEFWRNGWYWSSEDSGKKAVVLDMACGKFELVAKNMKNGYVRLISRYLTAKPEDIGYNLAYLRNGRFEVATDFRAELKDKLWGMQINRGYMSLRQESEKRTFFQMENLGKVTNENDLFAFDLPYLKQVEEVAKYHSDINEALAKISAYGVDVDLVKMNDIWWITKDRRMMADSTGFVTFGNRYIRGDELCTCRLWGYNLKGTVVI